MRRSFGLLLGLILLTSDATQARAQNITLAERESLLNHLQKTRADLEEATRGLSLAQWNFKPSIVKWSLAECLEHIVLSEELGLTFIRDQVMNGPAPPARSSAEMTKGDQSVLATTGNRDVRFQPSQGLVPKEQQNANAGELLKRFKVSRERTIDFARAAQELRNHCMDGPFAPCLDGYQWLLLISGHSARHIVQMLQVKAHPNFPKQ